MSYRIKPLEWEQLSERHWQASTSAGTYDIEYFPYGPHFTCYLPEELKRYATLAEAKAACETHHRQQVEALLEPEEGELATLVPLSECPPGFFEFEGMMGFKSNYSTNGFCDAFCDTGEYFWGGPCDHEARRKLLVRPVSRIATHRELARLRAENETLRVQVEDWSRRALDDLQLYAATKEDSERLDWLANRRGCVVHQFPGLTYIGDHYHNTHGRGDTLRAAIDAARKGEA